MNGKKCRNGWRSLPGQRRQPKGEDMDSRIRINMDTWYIHGREVKEKDIGRWCDLEQSTREDHDEVLKWNIEQ